MLNLAYFNYAKANKLNVKASKRIKKLLTSGNGDSKFKKSGNTSKKSDNKSDGDFDSNKFGKRKNNYLKGHRKAMDGQENGNT